MYYKYTRFSLNLPRELLDKLKYVAEYDALSANKGLEALIINYIKAFEQEHGPIQLKPKKDD